MEGEKSTRSCFEIIDLCLIATWGRSKLKQSYQSSVTWKESFIRCRVRLDTVSATGGTAGWFHQIVLPDNTRGPGDIHGKKQLKADERQNSSYPLILLTCFKNFPHYGISLLNMHTGCGKHTHRCTAKGFMSKAFRDTEDSVKRPDASSGRRLDAGFVGL